jgi:hypothetical protein
MDGGDLDFCVEAFDGSAVSGCSLSQIATAGAQLFATDDTHVTAVAQLGRDVGDLLDTFLDPEALGDPAGVDRVLRLLGSAASWEQMVGGTAVWEWFRCVAEAAFAAATGPGLDGTRDAGAGSPVSPRVAAVEAVLLLQQGDRANATAVVERYAAELVPVLIGPAGTLLAAPLIPLLCGVAPRTAIAILNGRSEPYVGASMLIHSLPDPRARALELDLVLACCQALERWAAWGVGVRRGPLLPPTHSDRFNVKRWETDSALLRLNFARHTAGVGDAATALTLLDDRDDPAAELARICADLAVYGFRVLEYPDNPAMFTPVAEVLIGHASTIERLHTKWGARPGDDTLLVRSESALARGMLAVVRGEPGAYDYFSLAVAHLRRFDGPWPWWMLAAASRDRDIAAILRELSRCAQLTGLRGSPRGLLLDVAERCGVDFAAAERTARSAIDEAFGPDVEPGMTPSIAYHRVAPLVPFYLDRSGCTHQFLALLAERCAVPLEPPTESLQLVDADAHAVFVAASIVDIANTHLDRFAPLAAVWLDAGSDDDADIDDAADREAIEHRRNERARRRAERRRPASSTRDTDNADEPAVRSADRVDDPASLTAALGEFRSTVDRRLVAEFGERLEAAADTLEPEALRAIADRWLTVLSHRDVRVALGDSGCDLEMIRALRRIDRASDAAPIAVGLFWRTHNSGGDPSDYAALAEELGAGAEDLAAIEGANSANRDDQRGPEGDPVSVVFVGGREEQARVASLVESDLTERFDDRVSITWFYPGWTSGWATDADRIAGALAEVHVAVVMSLVRTGLGERVRRDARFYDVPWVACTGHGRASMTRAVTAAVAVVDELRVDTDAEAAHTRSD